MSLTYNVAIAIAFLSLVYAAWQIFLDMLNKKRQVKVVCSSCNPDLIAAKKRGIEEAMQRLTKLIGDALLPLNSEVWPITFHLDGDTFCGQYESGITGFFKRDDTGLGHVCLFDMEKKNRTLPFTVENAEKIEDQLLPVHEAMHGWFVGRQENYRIQEPFCKFISFIISEYHGGPEYCSYWDPLSLPDGHPDLLMKYLCEMGMTSQSVVQILRQVAQSAGDKGEALSDSEFAVVVTSVLGKDAFPAFQSAGILD